MALAISGRQQHWRFQISGLLFQMLLFEGCLMSETLLTVLNQFLGTETGGEAACHAGSPGVGTSRCVQMKPARLPAGGAAENPGAGCWRRAHAQPEQPLGPHTFFGRPSSSV